MALFPNEYAVRLVAESSAKPCYICYKPVTTVLIDLNKTDFFYLCRKHLQDKGFGEPILPEDYNVLLEEKKKLEQQVEINEKDVELNRPYAWTRLVNGFSGDRSGKSNQAATEKSDSDKKELKENEDKEQAVKTKTNKSHESYEELKDKLTRKRAELEALNKKIESFDFKDYRLHKDIYQNRLRSHSKVPINKPAKLVLLLLPAFPSAPSHRIN